MSFPGSRPVRAASAAILAAAALSACAPLAAGRRSGAVLERQKGMSYACWQAGLYSRPESDESLRLLKETGTAWIALVVTVYQDDLASTAIAPNASTPTEADLARAIDAAHALGLKVMLKPHVDLARQPDHWRGEIGTAFRTPDRWAAWFASYRAMILRYAAFAADHGAEELCVGCELEGTSAREADWRAVVAAVRAVFRGPLIYASNWGGEEARLRWWDAVDAIGVDAYYPLAVRDDPTVAELKSAWAPRAAELERLAARWGRAVVLTEIGYRSIDGSCRHPWDWQLRGRIDLGEQADAYRAALETFFGRPWFGGMFWWSWDPDPASGGAANDDFTPHGKPAEAVLREWYSPSRPKDQEPRRPDPPARGPRR